jgi:hypothetical protein
LVFVHAVSRLFFSPYRRSLLYDNNQDGERQDNQRAILEILDESESESDNESIFSGDSNNYEPQENEDSDENNGT